MPSNEYYDSTGAPSNNSHGTSSTIRSEFDAIENGFKKLPALAGKNNLPLFINSGGTAFESKAISAARTLLDVLSGGEISALLAVKAELTDLSNHTNKTTTQAHGLGTASGGTLTTSTNDTNTGRVVKVGDYGLGTTGGFRLANGTTAQRPGSPSVAEVRYNSTVGSVERWNGAWRRMLDDYNIRTGACLSGGGGSMIEFDANANGAYIRFVGGLQLCMNAVVTPYSAGSGSDVYWTYAAAFNWSPNVFTNLRSGYPARDASCSISATATTARITGAGVTPYPGHIIDVFAIGTFTA